MHQFYSDIFQRVGGVWRGGGGEGEEERRGGEGRGGEGRGGKGKERKGGKGGEERREGGRRGEERREGKGREEGRKERRGEEKRREGGEDKGKDGLFHLSSLQIQNGEAWQEPSYLNAVLQEVLQSQYPSLEKRYYIHSTWDVM